MTKEDKLGNTNKFYLTFHEADVLLLENCRMGQKVGVFDRTKNKKQGH